MLDDSPQIKDLDELREYIHRTLCEHNELEINAFRMTERILVRRGLPCGLYFCLHGPRVVKLTAIWETERNTVLFYDAVGQRVQRCQLAYAPSFVPQAAC